MIKRGMNPDGPWTTEPGSLDWEHAGLSCHIIRGPVGALCGYVGVPRGHPLYGCKYSEPSAALAKRLSERLSEPIGNLGLGQMIACLSENGPTPTPEMAFDVHGGITYSENHKPKDGQTNLWWFGFDCAHSGDYTPGGGIYFEQRPYETYRDIEYVRAQCEHLAEQLAAVTPWTK